MTVAGVWENEYGSRMSLYAQGGAISGTYESTTGSTGKYRLTGWQGGSDPTVGAGQPVGLAIAWHSIVDGPPDPSWHWVSSLGGQLSMIDGEERLIMSHLLVASSAFPGLCEHGTFCDKLSYRRVTVPEAEPMPTLSLGGTVDDRLSGRWVAKGDAWLDCSVEYERHGRFGVVTGTLHLDGNDFAVRGFAGSRVDRKTGPRQSIALTAGDAQGQRALAIGGWLDSRSRKLVLQTLTSHATPADLTYLQTEISALSFSRAAIG